MKQLATYLAALQNSAIGSEASLEEAEESGIGHIAYARAHCRDVAVVIYADRAPITTGVAPVGSPDYLTLSSCYLFRLRGPVGGRTTPYSAEEEPAAFDWLLSHFDYAVEAVSDGDNFARLLAAQAEWFRQRY